MGLEGREVFPLLFWFLVSGVAIYATSKALGKVSQQIESIWM